MWEIPYICFFILVLGFVFFVMYVVYRLRMRRWAKRLRDARELQDTLLQTIQGSKFVADAALDKPDDAEHMRLTMERLSSFLGQATQEGQAVLNSLRTLTTETK